MKTIALPLVNFYDLLVGAWFLLFGLVLRQKMLNWFFNASNNSKGWIIIISVFLSWLALFLIPIIIKKKKINNSYDLKKSALFVSVLYMCIILSAIFIGFGLIGIKELFQSSDAMAMFLTLFFTVFIFAMLLLPLIFYGYVETKNLADNSNKQYFFINIVKYCLLAPYVILSIEIMRMFFIVFNFSPFLFAIFPGPIIYIVLFIIPRLVFDFEFPIQCKIWLQRYAYFLVLIYVNIFSGLSAKI